MTALTETVSGRLIPRQPPRAEPCDVRIYGALGGGITAECEPCNMRWQLEDGHTITELAQFEAQHQGEER